MLKNLSSDGIGHRRRKKKTLVAEIETNNITGPFTICIICVNVVGSRAGRQVLLQSLSFFF